MSLFNPDKIQVGISSCLLGDLVRYNGEHKASNFVFTMWHRMSNTSPFVLKWPLA